jgi:hypothetical protein
MATPNQNYDPQEALRLLQELNRLKIKLNEEPFNFGGAELQRQFKDLPRYIEQAKKQLESMEDSMSGIYGQIRAIVNEYKGQVSVMRKVEGAFKKIEDAAQDLKFDEQGVLDLNISQLKKLEKKVKFNEQILKQEARFIANNTSIGKELRDQVDDLVAHGAQADFINEYVNDYLKNTEEIEDYQKNLLKLYFDQNDAVDKMQRNLEKRLQQEARIIDLLGVSGGLVQGINSFMQGLGVNSGIFSEAVQDAEEAMRETAKNIELGLIKGGKLTVLMAGLGPIYAGLVKTLTDPVTIITKIVNEFFKVNVAAVEYNRLTGQNAVNQAALNSRLATSVDYLTTAAELTNRLGMSATSVFSNDDIAAMAEAKNLLGLTAEQAGSLGIQSKLANQDIDSFQDNLLKGVSAGNQLNNSLVAPGVAMNDILNTSEDITMSLGNDPIALGRAEVAARAFGMSLKEVSDIAGGLLNFEDSISAELEAELMTGRYLNLERARELALTNDLEGLSKELAKNGATVAEFSKMNRLEQDALAKALGMNREQLAESILAQEASKDATLEQRAAVMGVSKEQMQSMDIQKRMTAVIEKLAQAFAPILEAIVPVIEVLSSVLQPVAYMIGLISSGIGAMIKPLLIVYGLYKSIQIITTATLAVNRANYALKALEMGQEAFITREKGVQGIMNKQSYGTRLAYNIQLLAGLVSEQGIAGIKTFAATLDEKSLARKIIMNTYDGIAWTYEKGKAIWAGIRSGYEAIMLSIKQRSLLVDAKDLAISIGKAAMGVISSLSSIPVVGWALGLAAAAAVIGLGAKFMMKDGVIDPKKGPVVSGEFGTVQLNPNDQIVAGTDLMGNKSKKSTSISQAAAKSDNTRSEIKQMREENKSLLTALLHKSSDVYMDSNKVGKSLVLGSQKSS